MINKFVKNTSECSHGNYKFIYLHIKLFGSVDLKQYGFLMYVWLTIMNIGIFTYPNSVVSKQLKISNTAVNRMLATLKKEGYIEVSYFSRKGQRWRAREIKLLKHFEIKKI